MPHSEIFAQLVSQMLVDIYAHLSCEGVAKTKKTDVSYDTKRLLDSYRQFGDSYLTTTLPLLDEWLLNILSGALPPVPQGFKTKKNKSGISLPILLFPFWEAILDDESDVHYSMAIKAVRTLLVGFKKLGLPHSREQEEARISAFLAAEIDLDGLSGSDFPNDVLFYANRISDELFGDWLPTCNTPRHGPGAVAGRERGDDKWKFSTIYHPAHDELPYYEYVYGLRSLQHDPITRRLRATPLQLADLAKSYRAMPHSSTPTSRVLFVPKDSRGPRLIACEPKELMYLQQGVSVDLMNFLESHWMTAGKVNFRDQRINQSLAMNSSVTGSFATIDLSDASDRVGTVHLQSLLPWRLARRLLALRSVAAEFPSGEVIQLQKYATMGNALCFPVESIIFWLICVGAIYAYCGNDAVARDSVYVYGDDIIVRTEYIEVAMTALSSFRLVVNEKKSFYHRCSSGSFRESCGMEAYRGTDCTPLRIRLLPPLRPKDTNGLVAWCAYSSNMRVSMPRTAEFCKKHVESVLRRKIPIVPFNHEFLSVVWPDHLWSLSDFSDATWSQETCYYQSRQLVPRVKTHESKLDSWWAVQRSILSGLSEHDVCFVVDKPSTLNMQRCDLRHI